MITKGEAANNYDMIMDVVTKPSYSFYTDDGTQYRNEMVSTKKFINEILPVLNSVDELSKTYNKVFINPLLKICLLMSIKTESHQPVEFTRIDYGLVDIIYDQMIASVSHGYRLGLNAVRSHVQTMFKTDQNLTD